MWKDKRWLAIAAPLLFGGSLFGVYSGARHEGPGVVHSRPLPKAEVTARRAADQQILFGDLHVHTTYSADAFARSLPLVNGEGAHPPADACDFARWCSSLDFFAITDHAESLTPEHWRETKESIRQCNAVAGSTENPDLVAFVGWEWSQVGRTPEEHYGHRNVIYRDLDERKLPSRPIAAPGLTADAFAKNGGLGLSTVLAIPLLELTRRQRYLDIALYMRELAGVPRCAPGVDVRALPESCHEIAHDPRELFEKLAQWGLDALVIPHGSTWGFYTPPGYSFDKGLSRAQHDPEKQRLIEVYSGHGNSEEYRSFRAVDRAADGSAVCPAPTASYEPCCHRAGEIIRARCGDAPRDVCEARVRAARERYLAANASGHLTVPGATVEDWKDCGQCRDCFNPSFQYQPGGSVQYALAAGNLDGGRADHARFGFIASSDNHSARPGTGYKEFARRNMTEASGARDPAWRDRIFGAPEASAESVHLDGAALDEIVPFRRVAVERQASFFMTGGLVAVHSTGRSREAIWSALRRREVYGTSGERMLLWFDLVENGRTHPMGSEVALDETPRFVVRAAGAFEQKPGCPSRADGPSPERLARLCLGECYHPSEERRRVTRIEVVRIRPRRAPDEPVGSLIEDPWRRLDCPADQASCRVEFEDPEFVGGGREVAYYVRAIQAPTPAVNAGGLRCERGDGGDCARARPCRGGFETPEKDDCLSDNEERAWSSPIYVEPAGRSNHAR